MRKPGIFPPVWLYASVAREKALYSSTAMRTGQRYPKFDEIIEYEEKLGFPFECFISREPNLEEIKDKLEAQLRAIKKAIKGK